MSLTAIINLAERLLNNTTDQPVNANSSSRRSQQTTRAAADARVGDQFTPSAASQQDPGLFQVRQISIFSAAAEFLLAQTGQPLANPAVASPTVTVNRAATLGAPQPTPVPAQNVAQALVAAPTVPAALATAPTASAVATPATSTQNQLLALNTALYALGLNSAQLAQVDQVATLIKDFNPVAFTSLVFQLEALAQANAQPAAAANAPVTGTTAPTATTGNSVGTNNTGGFQIQELVIKFSGVQESFSQTGTTSQGGNTNTQLSAFNLQVEEINLTLANQAGQSLQVTAPQTAATPQSPAPTAVQAKPATA